MSAVLRDIRDLGDKETERAEISPRSRKNAPKTDEERAARQKRHDALAEEIQTIEARLSASGTMSALAEVGPVAVQEHSVHLSRMSLDEARTF